MVRHGLDTSAPHQWRGPRCPPGARRPRNGSTGTGPAQSRHRGGHCGRAQPPQRHTHTGLAGPEWEAGVELLHGLLHGLPSQGRGAMWHLQRELEGVCVCVKGGGAHHVGHFSLCCRCNNNRYQTQLAATVPCFVTLGTCPGCTPGATPTHLVLPPPQPVPLSTCTSVHPLAPWHRRAQRAGRPSTHAA
jgi:hypothetical protein